MTPSMRPVPETQRGPMLALSEQLPGEPEQS
jgi:hypothetical protein